MGTSASLRNRKVAFDGSGPPREPPKNFPPTSYFSIFFFHIHVRPVIYQKLTSCREVLQAASFFNEFFHCEFTNQETSPSSLLTEILWLVISPAQLRAGLAWIFPGAGAPGGEADSLSNWKLNGGFLVVCSSYFLVMVSVANTFVPALSVIV
jgi:hypothetical protein